MHGFRRESLFFKLFSISEAYSCFVLQRKFAKFLNQREKQSVKALMLVVCPLHRKNGVVDIRFRRGSGLFISDWAFGDASVEIN